MIKHHHFLTERQSTKYGKSSVVSPVSWNVSSIVNYCQPVRKATSVFYNVARYTNFFPSREVISPIHYLINNSERITRPLYHSR